MTITRLPLVAFALATALISCSGHSGSNTPQDPNPAPAPGAALGVAIDMNGIWAVTGTTITSSDALSPTPVAVGQLVLIQGGKAVAIGTAAAAASLQRSDIETSIGFPLDWYANATSPATGDFGYGWDRLRVAGGGGQFSDYVQYGFRVAAVSSDQLVGYEAEVRQDFLGAARTEWVAWHLLARQ